MTVLNSGRCLDEVVSELTSESQLTVEASPFSEGKLRFETYLKLNREYIELYGFSLVYCDNHGELIYGIPDCDTASSQESGAESRRKVLEQALNSGRPVPWLCGKDHRMWGIPLMLNNLLSGGLLAASSCVQSASSTVGQKGFDIDLACQGLLALSLKYNLVNLSYLEKRRIRALPVLEVSCSCSLNADETVSKMQEFLSERVPVILDHIRNQDIAAAREELEEIVQFIGALPQDFLCLAKGFVLDLLIAIDRASIEAGSDFATMLRLNCSLNLEVYEIENPRALSELLKQDLDQAENLMNPCYKKENDVTLNNILSFMERNFSKNLSRQSLAARFGVSVSHLSHLLNQKTGRTFVEILSQFRSDRAAQLLLTTDLPLIEISAECGFRGQSYFGKVFRRRYGVSPGRYRRNRAQQTAQE